MERCACERTVSPGSAGTSACCRRCPSSTLWPTFTRPGHRFALADERRDQGGLAGPVVADQAHVLAGLDPELGVLEEPLRTGVDRRVLHRQHDLARSLRLAEREGKRLRARRVALRRVALDAVDLLLLRLRPRRQRVLGPESLDEPFEAGDVRLAALRVALEEELAPRLLDPPFVPRAREELGAPLAELEHGVADGLQEPAVVCDQDRPRRPSPISIRSSHSSEAMSRWLVGSSSSSRSGFAASARASEARVSSPPEKVERSRSSSAMLEAEASHRLARLVAPAVAARDFEAGLRVGVGGQRGLARRRWPSAPRARPGGARSRAPSRGRRRRSRRASAQGRAEGAGRGARPGRPWQARRGRSPRMPRRRGREGASSCPSRCGPRAQAVRPAPGGTRRLARVGAHR